MASLFKIVFCLSVFCTDALTSYSSNYIIITSTPYVTTCGTRRYRSLLGQRENQQKDSVPLLLSMKKKNIEEPDFNPKRSTDISSLQSKEQEVTEKDMLEQPFIPKKPIELESLRQPSTFLGLEPKDDLTLERDSELPLFTSVMIMGMSLYFIYLALFGEDVLLDPSLPLAF